MAGEHCFPVSLFLLKSVRKLSIMALKDFWQQQRQQRQQAATQRRQQVSETLAIAQKERQELASELRSDLSLFRITLASADRDRTIEFQHFSVKLQQHRVERQRETQEFLTNVSDRRHSQAQQVASQLREFVQALQVQTADFLAVTEVERSAMAQQLADDLQTFRVVPDERVNALRQDIQTDIQDLQLETQAFLSESRQQRLKVQIRLTRNLAAFTESLRFEVQNYLSDVKTARHDRAASLAQTLHQNRTDREAKNGVLFSRLADFRSQLTSTIWGEDNSSKIESEVSEPVALQPSPVLKNPPTRLETLPTVPKISLSQKPVPAVERAEVPKPQSPSLVGVNADDRAFEEKVYHYIESMQGARLTEIESAMGISRFQAVDTLRSLIQKGLVTQRDRVYRIQEDFIV
jgi:gas vesicle GvpC-like protein